MRIGHGYDVHRMVPGRRCILCGVEIPYEMGPEAHSDGDAALHALMDAILGAAALGDIGKLFPDTDPKWKNADSCELLRAVADRISPAYRLSNCDITIIAQKPKLAAYIPAMRERIAEVLSVDPGQVSVKAATEEGLGFSGRLEGIAAHAVVLLEESANGR